MTYSTGLVKRQQNLGKTHVSLGIAYAAASGTALWDWQASRSFKTLFIDGEMPGQCLQERLETIVKSAHRYPDPDFLRFAAIDLNGGQMPDLSIRAGQAAIEELCNDAELIIVDNLSCLARSGRENEAESWIIVADWALRMRALGKCVIFIHHAGKKGDQRGTSKREDLLDVVIELKRPADYIPEQGARFIVNFTKARHLLGDQAQSFEACLMNIDDGKTTWKITTLSEGTSNQVVKLANSGLSQKEITEKLGVNKSTVSRHYRETVAEGLITEEVRRKTAKKSLTMEQHSLEQ